jgi:catechol 2,3-dioxygenase
MNTTFVTTGQKSATPLPATLRLGPVHLTVSDLARSIRWYETALGLHVHEHDIDGATARLGDGDAVTLVLVEDRGARPAGRHAGLYHYALLHPSREELARALVRLLAQRTPVQGASDHGTHEAIYLADPDGNGIELAADRPREQWPSPEEEFGRGGPLPLDIENLLATVAGEEPVERVGTGLRMGHVHLHVGSIEEGVVFYRDVIGFDVWAQIPTAAFVSAGGYHHHLGFNVWRGEGVPPAPDHTVGLRHWTVQLDASEEVSDIRARVEAAGHEIEAYDHGFLVRDPWGIALLFEVGS